MTCAGNNFVDFPENQLFLSNPRFLIPVGCFVFEYKFLGCWCKDILSKENSFRLQNFRISEFGADGAG